MVRNSPHPIQSNQITIHNALVQTVMEEKLIHRLESAVVRLETLSMGNAPTSHSSGGGGGGVDDTSAASSDPAIIALDDLISGAVGRLVKAGETIGGQVADVSKIVKEAFLTQKQILIVVKQTKKPDINGVIEFLKPLNEILTKAESMRGGRRCEFPHHLNAAADSLRALLWIGYTGKDCGLSMPIAHVEDSWQMAEFYSNKVLVEFRNKDANHVEWAKALKELYLPCLRDYVKSHYPLGPVWSTTGRANVSAPTKVPGAPGPPPPPPASLFSSDSAKPSSSRPQASMAAVFQEINSGKPVTSGLRKVTDDMKTKNRADKTGVVPVVEKETRSSTPSVTKTLPPKFELQMGRKWAVENQIGRKDLVVEECDTKQSVYVYGCKDSVLQVQGKVNNITIDKCTKTGIVFKGVVAACEIVNCTSLEVQCEGSAPTISVDNTSGCQLYLSKDSLEASITTAKSSEINVFVPGASPDDDWAQHSMPQQYIHEFKDGQFVTTPVLHSAG